MSQMKTPVNTHIKNKSAPKVVVPRHRRDRTGHARNMGYNAEVHFKQKCKEKQYTWENASKFQNCEQHIDCFIETPKGLKLSVDVKAAKKIARSDQKAQDKYTWIEWIRRDGKEGGLKVMLIDCISNVKWRLFDGKNRRIKKSRCTPCRKI